MIEYDDVWEEADGVHIITWSGGDVVIRLDEDGDIVFDIGPGESTFILAPDELILALNKLEVI